MARPYKRWLQPYYDEIENIQDTRMTILLRTPLCSLFSKHFMCLIILLLGDRG